MSPLIVSNVLLNRNYQHKHQKALIYKRLNPIFFLLPAHTAKQHFPFSFCYPPLKAVYFFRLIMSGLSFVLSLGNTAQSPPDGFALNLRRPKEVPLGYIFSVILHRNPLTYDSMPAEFLYNLTKKSVGASSAQALCGVAFIIDSNILTYICQVFNIIFIDMQQFIRKKL